MKKSVTKNYIYNLLYQILIIILPLITTPYISRVLGAENIGIYSYTLSISAFFILFGSLGVALYGQREIAFVQDDKNKYSTLFWEIEILKIISMTISIIVFCFSFASHGEYAIYYRLLIIEMIGNAIDISWFFQGLEEFKKIVIRNTIIKILSVISVFIFVKTANNLMNYFIIYIISLIIGNISLWLYLSKFLEKISIKQLNIIKHLKPTIHLFIPQIATQVYTVLDKTMIGSMILDKAEVGYYEQSQKIVKIIMTIVTSLGTVMLPRIANDFVNGKKEEIKRSILTSFNFVYFLSIPMAIGLMAVSKDLVPCFLGNDFEKSINVIYVISPIILMIGLSNVVGIQYLLPTQKQKQYTISVIMGAIINLMFNFIFIPMFKSIGAAIGTVIAETTVTLIQLHFIKKEFNLKEIFALGIKYIVSALIMLLVIIILNKLILINYPRSIRMFVDVLTGVGTYVIVLIMLKDKFLIKIKDKVLKNKDYNNGSIT